ncbi:MAG: TolA-binding protein [Myxococcota bacterium]|jgi:TolA-binding protein
MSGPRRLLDDPDFRWETGCDLGDEALLHDGLELGALKDRVLSSVTATPVVVASSSTGSAISGAASVKGVTAITTALIAAVGVGYWLGTSQPAPAPAPSAPLVEQVVATGTSEGEAAPMLTTAPMSASIASPAAGTDDEDLPAASVSQHRPAAPAKAAAPVEPERTVDAAEAGAGTGDAPADDVGSAPAAAAIPAAHGDADALSGVAAETALYDLAAQAMASRALVEAAHGFRTYLSRYPSGHLAPEAELSLLECLFAEGSFADAEAQAARLLGTAGFGHRQRELSLVRAESLILLDRCDEALAIVNQLDGRDARVVAVRRECKRRR